MEAVSLETLAEDALRAIDMSLEHHGIELITDTVTRIVPGENRLELKGGEHVTYNYLVPVDGGVPTKLADSVEGGWSTPTWLDDNTIVFAGDARELRQVADTGGASRVVWRNDTTGAALPVGLPGSRGIAFIQCMAGICARPTLTVLDLESGATRLMGEGVLRVQYSPTGHLVVLRADGTMHAIPFDVRTLRAEGQPFPVANQVFSGNGTAAWFSLSSTGTLGMWRGARFIDTENHRLWWYDRSGRASPLDSSWTFALGAAGLNGAMWSLSPDGTRLAIGLAGGGGTSVWLKTMPDGPVSRLTFQPGTTFRPKFTPDGRYVSYFLTRRTAWDLYRTAANGSGTPEHLLARPGDAGYESADWSRDGTWVVLHGRGVNNGRDVFAARLGVDTAAKPLLATAFEEQNPTLSPDGRWLAYQSNESGRYEIYVRPFPDVDGGKWLVSRAAGTRSPVWSKDGRELYYIDDVRRELVAVPITTSPEFAAGAPRTLFGLPDDAYLIHFITDGQRFLIARRPPPSASQHRPLIVTENWTQELRQLVPSSRP